jgi:hypothetical protein
MKDRRRSLRGDRRLGTRLAIWCAAMLAILLMMAANMWLRAPAAPSAADVPLHALTSAYAQVTPGETSMRTLTRLGFDTSRGGVERLPYLALMDYFIPHDSDRFDQMDPAVQQCLARPDGCTAYIFRLARARGSEQKAAFGFVNAASADNAPAVIEVLFLIRDGRVAYKAMNGV